VQLVIVDTGPINYLILIEQIDILPVLFEKVVLPTAVQKELMDMDAPAEVRGWMDRPPVWLEILEAPATAMDSATLDDGETAVIGLAESLHADVLLMDERRGVKAGKTQGEKGTGLKPHFSSRMTARFNGRPVRHRLPEQHTQAHYSRPRG